MYKYLILFCCFCYPNIGAASTVSWVDWSYINSTSISGVVDGVDVSFSGSFYDGYYPVSGSSTNFWDAPSSVAANTYSASPSVDNAPSDSDIIIMREAGTRTITFSQPVVNPVMSILSMGSASVPVQFQFDTDFNILSVGPGTFDPSGYGTLTKLGGNVLQGVEGHGLIQFVGTYTSISWDANVYENFYGIQIGTGSSVVPVPPAVWLFGTGLMGLISIARRKKA